MKLIHQCSIRFMINFPRDFLRILEEFYRFLQQIFFTAKRNRPFHLFPDRLRIPLMTDIRQFIYCRMQFFITFQYLLKFFVKRREFSSCFLSACDVIMEKFSNPFLSDGFYTALIVGISETFMDNIRKFRIKTGTIAEFKPCIHIVAKFMHNSSRIPECSCSYNVRFRVIPAVSALLADTPLLDSSAENTIYIIKNLFA